jgi:hypothetical protein
VLTLDDTVSRPSQSFRILNADQHFSADGTYTNMREPRIHSSLASVQLSLAALASGEIATWNFPAITGSSTFVGVDAAQTLRSKKYDRLAGDSVVSPATCTVQNAAGTGGTASLASFSSAIGGTVTVTTGTATTTGGLVRLSFPTWGASARSVTLTAASITAAGVPVYTAGTIGSEFYLGTTTPLAASTVFSWHYHIVG